MSWHGPEFVLFMIAIGPVTWVLTKWIRARYGYPLTNEDSDTVGKDGLSTNRKAELLSRENERLQGPGRPSRRAARSARTDRHRPCHTHSARH